MPTKAQIAWRKKFAKMSKAGKFKKSSSGFKPIPSSKLRKGTVSHTMAVRAEKEQDMLKSTTGYIVSSPRYPNGRIFKTLPEAMKEYRRQQKYGGAGVSGKTTVKSKNPKFHKVGNYWTP